MLRAYAGTFQNPNSSCVRARKIVKPLSTTVLLSITSRHPEVYAETYKYKNFNSRFDSLESGVKVLQKNGICKDSSDYFLNIEHFLEKRESSKFGAGGNVRG
jgi:hypothetical protein